jgi:hypothetical protein
MPSRPCPCGSGLPSHWQHDARGIALARTCDTCHERKMAKYRPDVLTDGQYWTDEPVEPEE